MVIFGVALATDARNSKSSTMIGFEHLTLPTTVAIGGWSAGPPNFSPGFASIATPSSCVRKSRCHQSRRNSPSVTDRRPSAS
jgi:hypothetical protein